MDRRAPPRRAHQRGQRRLGAQRRPQGHFAADRVPEPAAGDAALVPRPRDGDHALQRPHRPGRDVPDPRRRGGRARPAGRRPRAPADHHRPEPRHRPAPGALTGQLLFKFPCAGRPDDPVHRPVQPGQRRDLAAPRRRRAVVPLPAAQRGQLAVLHAQPGRREQQPGERRRPPDRHRRRPAARAHHAPGERPDRRPGRAVRRPDRLQPLQGAEAQAAQRRPAAGRGRAGPDGVPRRRPRQARPFTAAGEDLDVLHAAGARLDAAGGPRPRLDRAAAQRRGPPGDVGPRAGRRGPGRRGDHPGARPGRRAEDVPDDRAALRRHHRDLHRPRPVGGVEHPARRERRARRTRSTST